MYFDEITLWLSLLFTQFLKYQVQYFQSFLHFIYYILLLCNESASKVTENLTYFPASSQGTVEINASLIRNSENSDAVLNVFPSRVPSGAFT